MFIPAYFFATDKLTDISYAVSFVLVALYGLIVGGAALPSIVLSTMIFLWALRLGTYLLIRIHKMGRDKRFDGMRESFSRFFKFWFFQGLTVWVVLVPTLLFMFSEVPASLDGAMLIGIIIWLVGLLVEVVADYQKFAFIQNPQNKGKWIASGLWKYSRHPNYFGEILVWVGVYIFTLSILSGVSAFLALVGPLYIASILLFFSGVPLLEKGADKHWGNDPQYQAYKKRTSLIIPLPNKQL